MDEQEKYVCFKAKECTNTGCVHRKPHELDDKCYAPPGHISNHSHDCGLMPETRCVPESQLETSAKSN